MKKNMQHAYLKGMPLFKMKEQNHAHVPKKPERLNENDIGRVWRHIIFFFERLTLHFQ